MENKEKFPPIVLQNGSGTCKVGFGGDHAPCLVLPTLVGTRKAELDTKNPLIGNKALSSNLDINIKHPITRGVVTNWEAMEQMWHHVFYNELKVKPEKHPILITEPPLNPLKNREKMIKSLFEVFNVVAAYVCIPAVLSIYSGPGRMTGLVVHSGEGVTQIVPVFEGYIIPHGVLRINLAGNDVTENLRSLLRKKGKDYSNSQALNHVRELKEKYCFVFDTSNEKNVEVENILVELSNGSKILMGSERYVAPDILFSPVLFGRNEKGISELVFDSLFKCPIDVRKDLYSNILLSGGNTLFEGFAKRLESDLSKLCPESFRIKVVHPPGRKYSAWIGGSILSYLSTFQTCWILREEYEHLGLALIYEKQVG
eukprot:snap_masked-scaffold_2-processed-gene-18.53-mRNA-1 protein AED:0.32 eAED:0.32 QI:0/-1/0/1/-1/1/1/0/369